MSQGYIKLHRQIWENEQWLSEPFTRSQAWIDLLLLANHKSSRVYIRGNKIEVPRGCVCRSKETLATRWSWSRGKVLRYLKQLEMDQQIVLQKNNSISLIEVINYDKFQPNGTTDDTTDGQQTVQQTDNRQYTYKNVKNVKNENNPPSEGHAVEALVVVEEQASFLGEVDEGLKEFAELATMILRCKKVVTDSARKKYKARLKSFTHEELMAAMRNVANEPDQWKIKNVPNKPLAWWLKSDDYIAELLQLHLKGNSKQGTIIT